MRGELEGLSDLESAKNNKDPDVTAFEKEDAVSKKQQASFDFYARRRVELKLEEAYMRRQVEAYGPDDDAD